MPAKDLINKQVDQALSANSPATMMAVRGVLRFNGVPSWLVYIAVIMVVASWIPLAFAVRSKFNKSSQPRVHMWLDMDAQAKFKEQTVNPFFANEMANRPPIAGTVARGNLYEDDLYNNGFEMRDGEVIWAESIPDQVEVTPELLAKGKELWARYCYLCHGYDGYGNGPVHVRATNNVAKNPKWVAPSNLHDEVRLGRPDGHIYNTINIGIRNMSGYGNWQIPDPEDRWAVVAYVRALQMSQNPPAEMWPEKVDGIPVQPTLMNGEAMVAVAEEEGAAGGDDAATQPAEGSASSQPATQPAE